MMGTLIRAYDKLFAAWDTQFRAQEGIFSMCKRSSVAIARKQRNGQPGQRSSTGLAGPLPLSVRALVGRRHTFGDATPTAALAFAGAVVPLDRDAIVTEVECEHAVTPSTTLGLAFSSQYGSGATDSAIEGRFTLTF
jgi:hypothetical protein